MPRTSDWTTRPLDDELGEALRAELLGWPGVTIRPMMGCLAFCRIRELSRKSGRQRIRPRGQAGKPVPPQMLGCYVNRELSKKKPRWMNRPGEPTLAWVRLSADDAERALRRPGVHKARTGAVNWIEIPLDSRAMLKEAVRWFGCAYEHPPRAGRKRASRTRC